MIVVMKYHEETSGALASLTEGRHIFPKGAHYGMAQQKLRLKTLEATAFSKMLSTRIIFNLEKVRHKNSVILNHVDSNHTNTNFNHSNPIDFYYADPNQLIPNNLTTIIDSADARALNKLLLWDMDSMDASSITVYTRTPLAYLTSTHTAHTTSLVHSLH